MIIQRGDYGVGGIGLSVSSARILERSLRYHGVEPSYSKGVAARCRDVAERLKNDARRFSPPAERYMRDAETLLDYAKTIDGAA